MIKELITLPLIPLRGLTIFPSMIIHFDAGRKKSIAAIEYAMENNQDVFLVTQKDPLEESPKEDGIYTIGVICKIKQIVKLPGGESIKVLVEGSHRAEIKEFIDQEDFIKATVQEIEEEEFDNDDVEIQALFASIKKTFIKLIKLSGDMNTDIVSAIKGDKDLVHFVDMVSSYIPMREEKKQDLLETLSIKKRIEKLLVILENEIEIVKVQNKINTKMKEKIDASQREYYLREQLKLIQEELGEDDEEQKEIKEYEDRIKKTKFPAEVRDKVNYELKRLKGTSGASSEGNAIKSYLDWVLDIPWNKTTKESVDLKKAKSTLEKDHYGLEEVKERILEQIAVKKYSTSSKGPIICLVGPPGVGKTSIVKSIATALNRKYVRISLGGMKDEAEIRGHRRTYVAAIPGRICYALKEAKTMNPLILLDEIDKLGSKYNGDPADALLEVLDSEQNKSFRDNYLEVNMDISKAMFITTANTLDTIPRPLLDRMEVIEVTGYTYEEKFHIAKEHLIPKILANYNLSEDVIKISNEAIKEIINGYTRESGVRTLERTLNSLIRKVISEMVSKNKDSMNINVKKVENLLGTKKFYFDEIDRKDKVGVVTGLAWTAYGGDTLPVETMVMEGTGKLQLTGQLGDVMQESAKAAYTYVRANAKKIGVDSDFYKNKDVHIHVPEGAVPKDGPSAGVTMVTSLVSALSKRKVKGNVAMTGEVTLTGRVLPIGGLKEKSLAAYRAGVDTIIIPKENERDIEEIPTSIKNKLNIITAEEVGIVLKNALIGDDTNEN